MQRKNVKPSELARRMGVPRQAVDRMIDVRHITKIDTLAEAMNALGGQRKLVIKTVAA
jgi:antitoxin HicB